MNEILLILIIFMLGLIALMVCSNWYMQFCLKMMIGKKHEWLDFILDTSCVPESWSRPFAKRIALMTERNIGQEQIQSVRISAKTSYLHKLNKLIKYVKVATLIPDEASRSQILKSLLMIEEQWNRYDESEGNIY